MLKLRNKNSFGRSPNLQTVLMVEAFIKENSGEFNRTQIWNRLPRKIMWQTFLIILDYLENNGRILTISDGRIIYTWNPELLKRIRNRKRY